MSRSQENRLCWDHLTSGWSGQQNLLLDWDHKKKKKKSMTKQNKQKTILYGFLRCA